MKRNDVRNVAVIAHVDHGKTTIVDSLLKFSGQFNVKNGDVQVMVLDSNPLERERGITILAKCTSVNYKNNIINIVDTPGHADFGSEVERVLKMVEGVILMVDAVDGPMPQTRFVLRKALSLGLKPIVIVNKMDRPNTNPSIVIDNVFDLFIKLGATDKQLDFPIIYASGRDGWASLDMEKKGKDIEPVFKTIMSYVPAPEVDSQKPLQMQITMLDYNNFLGSIGIGRILNGFIKKGQLIALVSDSGIDSPKITKALRIDKFYGLEKQEVENAQAGDIVAISGLENVKVGDTICSLDNILPLPKLSIDDPTVSMYFFVNDSPFAGREGKFLTSRHIKERLDKEVRTNLGLGVEVLEGGDGRFKVSGRGELHLTVLIETMRREGFELSVSSPEVIYKEIDNKVYEPMEFLTLNIESQYQGAVFELAGARAAIFKDMINEGENRIRLEYIIPSRALIGFKNEFLTNTKGRGIMHYSFYDYLPKVNMSAIRKNGVFVAREQGKTTAYALDSLQISGQLFVGPGVEVYEGMIIGQNSRENDLIVNPCKLKKLSNMRSKGSDDAPILTPPRLMNLERAVEYIASDELVEVTPTSIRLRKKILNHLVRKRFYKDETTK
ncbi:MAG: translational GTPase TypA [Endomicrobium sp.]|jgi:GTP-binding protein|nr:translational GTPase TypA [Endomicrobium sp.]